MDELYVIEKLWPTAKALAVAKSEKDGNDYACIWTNDYHGTRVFGTTSATATPPGPTPSSSNSSPTASTGRHGADFRMMK